MSGEATFTLKPSDEVVAQASEKSQIVDARGRAITLKNPGILEEFRMVEMLGESASNQTFMNMVFPLTFVTEIDGIPISRITKRSELDGLIQQLDRDGVAAVMDGVRAKFDAGSTEAQQESAKK